MANSQQVQFIGCGIDGFPFLRGNSRNLKCGNIYDVKGIREEAGEVMLKVSDTTGKIVGTFPAQWFNPLSRLALTDN